MNLKQIIAGVAAIALILCLIATIITAFIGNTTLLFALVFIDIVIPICLYAYFTIYKVIKKSEEEDKKKR